MLPARRLAPVLLTGAALIAAGCGGSGEERLTRAEFVQRGNAICKKYDDRTDALTEPKTVKDIPAFVDRATRELDAGLRELRALDPPEDLQPDLDRFVSFGEDTKALAGELKSAAAANDEQALAAASQRGDNLERRSDAVARRLGLDQCAED